MPECIARACVNAEEWDAFLDRVPWATAQHAFGYGEALASCFHYVRPAYRLFESGGRVVAGLPLTRFRAGGPFRAVYSLVFSMYGGPLVDPDHLEDRRLLNRITEEIDSESSRFGAFEARFTLPPTAPDAVNRCVQAGRPVAIVRRDCPLLRLDRPLGEIIKGFHPSARRGVRRSQRLGVRVEQDAPPSTVRRAYPLYRRRMALIGATPKPWRFLETILERKLGVAFLARHEDKTVALLILLVSANASIFWTSAFEPSASSVRPMNALMEAAIRWSHRRGVTVFNFGESFGGREGLVRFKYNWGPSPAANTVTIRTYRPWVRRTWLALERPARWAYGRWDARRHPVRAESP